MPPIIKTDRRAIVDAAIAIIEESGASALTARAIAEKLGVSTQPIYREFSDMDELKACVSERGFELFSTRMTGEALEQAAGYISFATEHKNLFGFLFDGKNCRYDGLDDMAHKLLPATDIVDRLQEINGLPRETEYRAHLLIWMAIHGLAEMAAHNDMNITDGEIREFTLDISRAVAEYYRGSGK